MARQPTLYDLSGKGIHVSFTTANIAGKPVFSYHDAHQTKTFTGDEIKIETTVIGRDGHGVPAADHRWTFDVFLCAASRRAVAAVQHRQYHGRGITTLHRSSIIGPPIGQIESYAVQPLEGTARFVES
jgi:hypothetical protein